MEIIGSNFVCNLSEVHLNQFDPTDFEGIDNAFRAGALSVAALLHHEFTEPRFRYSRELDPIVGVSFTGLFDFFVNAFGVDWLRWWEAGRPNAWYSPSMEKKIAIRLAQTGRQLFRLNREINPDFEINDCAYDSDIFRMIEMQYLTLWREIVHQTIWDYCDRHGLKRPNRCTTVQPAGSKSLLTGASPGWHPPKAARFIRRITFAKNDPVALACLDCGYSVIPSQSDKDENGILLDDPFDPRCSEWLVEIPVATSWADLPGADQIDISKFSALAQIDFYMQVQKHYTTHNTSATWEIRESEIEDVSQRIHQAIQNDEGYISAAILSRFDDLQTYPRLPFEPIDKEAYEQMVEEVEERRQTDDFHAALTKYDKGEMSEAGPAGCDSDKCMFPTK